MILGVLRLIVFLLDTALFIPVLLLASPLDRNAKLAHRIARHWCRLNLALFAVRVHVDGCEHLDPEASYVFMSNHRSNLDVLALVWTLWNFQLRWVAKEELARVPGFGWAIRAMKHIIVNRSSHAQALASLETAKQRLHDGISVVFFPEGTRGTGAMLPFKKGGFVFALETGAPIVPIGIGGTAAILPRGSCLVRRGGDVGVRVGRPIPTAGLTVDARDALMAKVREAIAAAVEPAREAPADARRAAVLGGCPRVLPGGGHA